MRHVRFASVCCDVSADVIVCAQYAQSLHLKLTYAGFGALQAAAPVSRPVRRYFERLFGERMMTVGAITAVTSCAQSLLTITTNPGYKKMQSNLQLSNIHV